MPAVAGVMTMDAAPAREYAQSAGRHEVGPCFLQGSVKMTRFQRRFLVFAVCSSGTLLASTCDQVANTILAAFQIVDIWV